MKLLKCETLAVILILATAAGCQNNHEQGKVELTKKWQATRASVLVNLGQQHLTNGELDKASAKAQEALALDNDSSAARLLMAKVSIEQGRWQGAIAQLEHIGAKVPESAEVAYLLGVAHEKNGQLEAALIDYKRSQALCAGGVNAAVAAGEVLVALGRQEEAEQYIGGYLSQGGDDAAIYELAGRIATIRGDSKAAMDCYHRALDIEPKNMRYTELSARAEFGAGRFSEAAATLNKLAQSQQYSSAMWVHSMLGDCYLVTGRASEARDCYYRASDLQPQSPGVWVNLAKAALALKDSSRAKLCATHAISLDPSNQDAKLLLGAALLQDCSAVTAGSNDPQAAEKAALLAGQARAVLQKAAAEHPDNVMIHCLLGRAYVAGGDTEQAKGCFNEVLRREPGNVLARELLATLE